MTQRFHVPRARWGVVCSLLAVSLLAAAAGTNERPAQLSIVTKIGQLDDMATQAPRTVCSLHLEAAVCWADPAQGLLVLEDDSGAAYAEVDPQSDAVEPGQKVLVEGDCTVSSGRGGLRVGRRLVVDNDGIHGMDEKSGSLFLPAGRHSIAVSWFGRDGPHGLEVDYQGPGLPRQRIANTALFRLQGRSPAGAVAWSQGLECQAYEGRWVSLPDFQQLAPARQGIVNNFDLGLKSGDRDMARWFAGYVEVPRDGVYTFSTISTLGSQLFVGLPRLRAEGILSRPEPRRLALDQALPAGQASTWVEMEGVASFVNSLQSRELSLDLRSGAERVLVEVADGSGGSPRLIGNSRIRVIGVGRTGFDTEDRRVQAVLVPERRLVQLLEAPPQLWQEYPVLPIGEVVRTNFADATETIVHVAGKIQSVPAEGLCRIGDGSGQLLVETCQLFPWTEGSEVEALGCWSRSGTNVILQGGVCREVADSGGRAARAKPLLTTAEQVKRLKRDEALRHYPVKLRGVVTATFERDAVIQDATGGIYIEAAALAQSGAVLPRVGECWEFEGETGPGDFAPVVVANGARFLGGGNLPAPSHPTWDQLINGSMDSQYVEIQGIITLTEAKAVTLLTPGGRIGLGLLGQDSEALRSYENALVRIRGCVFPSWDPATHQVKVGEINLVNGSVCVDEPAADPFAAPAKSLPELLLYDPRAGALQRVKVTVQITHQRGGTYYATDGTNGLRFIPKRTLDFRAGDRVEVVGFPELNAPSPILREAVVRRISHGDLPPPQPLAQDSLLSRRYDSRPVRLEARLANVNVNQGEQILELQAGARGLTAELDLRAGALPPLQPGSRLEVTGIYAGQGGDLVSLREVDSFELLLNSAADIRVLARPSWWSVKHTLTVAGAMALVLLGAVVWITLLRRQVEERSQQLATEVRHHEQTQRERAVEEERARIAQDLHDDLGATLTQIRFLSALESRDAHVPESTRSRMSEVSEKLRQMVASLDEIVWAVNPANDSLSSLATYLCQFAEEFFRATPIRCRLDVADTLPTAPLTSEVRHNLYLAVREALNNAAKHSRATEIWLRIGCPDHCLQIALEDNGRGFSNASALAGGDGLANMRRRLEKISGHFEYETREGAGTTCRIWLPLKQKSSI